MEGWELEPYLEIVNKLQPDIIVITGDIISWGTHYTKPVVRPWVSCGLIMVFLRSLVTMIFTAILMRCVSSLEKRRI